MLPFKGGYLPADALNGYPHTGDNMLESYVNSDTTSNKDLARYFQFLEVLDEIEDIVRPQEFILDSIVSFLGAQGGMLAAWNFSTSSTIIAQKNLESANTRLTTTNIRFIAENAKKPRIIKPDDPLWPIIDALAEDMEWAVFPIHSRNSIPGFILVFKEDAKKLSLLSDVMILRVGKAIGQRLEFLILLRQFQESKHRYRRIFQQSKDMLYETTKEGRILDINKAGVEMFGYEDRQELLRLDSMASLYAKPKDRYRFIDTIERDGFVKDYEAVFVTKQGNSVDVSITSTVRRDDAGKILGYEGIIRDISPYKKLLGKLSDSETKYRTMVENSADGIGIYSNTGFMFVNSSFLKMFGYEEFDEIRNIDIIQFIADESRGQILDLLRKVSEGSNRPLMGECRGIRKDGSTFWVEMHMFRIVFTDERAVQITFRDVSEKKIIEEHLIQSERLTATGKLAFNIAHEINNPLGGIIAYCHLIAEDLSPGSIQHQNIEKALKLANRCKIIVRGLLDFARDDSEEKEQTDINSLIRETLFLLEGHVILKNITVDFEPEGNLPRIRAVKSKLEQVFLNLIVNAAEAMEGNGRLSIASEFVRSANILRVFINDTGHGVESGNMKKIFEPFYTTKKRGRGTGLGLSISHGIIKQHRGTITIESQSGQGSTFIIELPV